MQSECELVLELILKLRAIVIEKMELGRKGIGINEKEFTTAMQLRTDPHGGRWRGRKVPSLFHPATANPTPSRASAPVFTLSTVSVHCSRVDCLHCTVNSDTFRDDQDQDVEGRSGVG